MKLNEKEAKILASVEWAADKQLSEIAKETGYQEHTVRYYLRRMEEAGVIERVPFMDLSSLGYQYVGIFFSIGLPPEKVPDALKSLTALPEVVWLAELGGDYQFGLGLCVQHVSHVQNFLFTLTEQYPALFYRKSVSIQFSYVRFPRGYLDTKRNRAALVSQSKQQSLHSIDELDTQILHTLAHQNPKSRRELSRLLGKPLSTLDKRLKKLSDKGIIVRYIYDVQARTFGMQLYSLMVFLKGFRREFHRQFHEFCAHHPNIVELYSGVGAWDYEINIEVADPALVPQLTQLLVDNFSEDIALVKSVQRYRDLKYTQIPF